MINVSLKEGADLSKRQENSITSNISKATSSSKSWSKLKDPRIVRVSRAFGGKDRHSKVFTMRGLRDRRVRLSVPTATQLYDLQEKLGLNQPSKVVDWLLNAAKDEINELPPLPFPPENFVQNLQPMLITSHANTIIGAAEAFKFGSSNTVNWNNHFKNINSGNSDETNSKEVSGQAAADDDDGQDMTWNNKGINAAAGEGKQDLDLVISNGAYLPPDYCNHLLMLRSSTHSSLPAIHSNVTISNNPFHGWNISPISLSHSTALEREEGAENVCSVPFSSASQALRPHGATQSYRPAAAPPAAANAIASEEFGSKQVSFNDIMMNSSSSQNPS